MWPKAKRSREHSDGRQCLPSSGRRELDGCQRAGGGSEVGIVKGYGSTGTWSRMKTNVIASARFSFATGELVMTGLKRTILGRCGRNEGGTGRLGGSWEL